MGVREGRQQRGTKVVKPVRSDDEEDARLGRL